MFANPLRAPCSVTNVKVICPLKVSRPRSLYPIEPELRYNGRDASKSLNVTDWTALEKCLVAKLRLEEHLKNIPKEPTNL